MYIHEIGILPYTFEKRITDNGRGGRCIEFTATNTGEHDFDFIWAGCISWRPAEEGGYVLSPYAKDAKAEIVFSSNAEKYGERGDVCTLPYGVDGTTRLDVSKAYGAGNGDAWKFYYSEAVPRAGSATSIRPTGRGSCSLSPRIRCPMPGCG